MEENKKNQRSSLDELDELLNGEANYTNALECAHILRDEITKLKNKADYRLNNILETAELIETTELMEITELIKTINEINKLLAFGIKSETEASNSRYKIKDNEYYVELMEYLKREYELLKALKEKYESIGKTHNDETKDNTKDGFDFGDI